MNAYYQRTNRTIVVTDNNPINVGDKLISLICTIVAFFTSAVAVKVEKAVLCTVCFVAFFGVIGSMESGNIGLLGGILLCAALTLVEFFIFKSMVKRNKSSN